MKKPRGYKLREDQMLKAARAFTSSTGLNRKTTAQSAPSLLQAKESNKRLGKLTHTQLSQIEKLVKKKTASQNIDLALQVLNDIGESLALGTIEQLIGKIRKNGPRTQEQCEADQAYERARKKVIDATRGLVTNKMTLSRNNLIIKALRENLPSETAMFTDLFITQTITKTREELGVKPIHNNHHLSKRNVTLPGSDKLKELLERE